MAIPNDNIIQIELLRLLNKAEDGTMDCNDVYNELGKLFPKITVEEKNLKYRESKSEWANRVQFARLHCVNKGFILSEPAGKVRGLWTITKGGRDYINRRTFKR